MTAEGGIFHSSRDVTTADVITFRFASCSPSLAGAGPWMYRTKYREIKNTYVSSAVFEKTVCIG